MSSLTPNDVHEAVRDQYGKIARTAGGCCSPTCCSEPAPSPDAASRAVGYTNDDLATVPEGANMGLGCGNPQAIASLKAGEVVLDLGSGGGFDCFLAARQVGASGRVIGVDMTPEMIAKARRNAASGGYDNVEFRLGEIERLPVDEGSVDVIISNCVINLSPDKPQVFREAFRVLKPGGRLAVSDIVAKEPLPEEIREDVDLLTGCVAGASMIADVQRMLVEAGFSRITVTPNSADIVGASGCAGNGAGDYIVSANMEAVKLR